MIDLDRLSDEQLRRLEAEFKRICANDSAMDAESADATEPAAARPLQDKIA